MLDTPVVASEPEIGVISLMLDRFQQPQTGIRQLHL